jgi:hypothetical protein
MPLSESKLAEALTELYDSPIYAGNSAGDRFVTIGAGGINYGGGGVGSFSLRGNDDTHKKKWKATAEVIAEYLKDVLPPINTPVYQGLAASIIELQQKTVNLSNFSDKLARVIDGLGKAAGAAMLPLYTASPPKDSDLSRKLIVTYTSNSQYGKTNAESAKAIAEVVHEFYKKGSAQPASGFIGFPPIPTWAIAEMPGAEKNGRYSTDQWTPIDHPKTPVANRLRAALRALGYGEKLIGRDRDGGEIANNPGTATYHITDIAPELANFCIWLFGLLRDEIPDLSICCSGGNDKFHNPDIPTSSGNCSFESHHTVGTAMDFVIAKGESRGHNSTVLKVEDILRGIEGSTSNLRPDHTSDRPKPYFRFINEYYHLSEHGTGDHFHIIVVPRRNHGNRTKDFSKSTESTGGGRWKLSRKAVQNGRYNTTNEATGATYQRECEDIPLPSFIRADM